MDISKYASTRVFEGKRALSDAESERLKQAYHARFEKFAPESAPVLRENPSRELKIVTSYEMTNGLIPR